MVWRSDLLGIEIDPSPPVTRSPSEFAYLLVPWRVDAHQLPSRLVHLVS